MLYYATTILLLMPRLTAKPLGIQCLTGDVLYKYNHHLKKHTCVQLEKSLCGARGVRDLMICFEFDVVAPSRQDKSA